MAASFLLKGKIMPKKSVPDRDLRLREICNAINKGAFGGENHDAVVYLGSADVSPITRFPSGCLDLDEALGGGWPKGRFIEVFGPEAGGKTTIVLHALAEYQKAFSDDDTALIDSEYSFDEEYAKALGVDMRYLIVNQPESGEQALNVMSQLIQLGVKLVVVDSVAALTPKSELEGDVGEGSGMAEQARIMSKALRRLTIEAGSRDVTIFWTNQIREKLNVVYGDKTTTPAGRALKHYASIRLKIDRIATIREKIDGEDVAVSNRTKAEVKKNKTAAPFKVAEFYITYGHGIDSVAAILDAAIARGVIEKRGSWFSFEGEQIGQGRAESLELMRTDSKFTEKIVKALDQTAEESKPVESAEPSSPIVEKLRRVKRTPVIEEPLETEPGDVGGEPLEEPAESGETKVEDA